MFVVPVSENKEPPLTLDVELTFKSQDVVPNRSDASDVEIVSGLRLERNEILSPVRPSCANSNAICFALIPQLFATLR